MPDSKKNIYRLLSDEPVLAAKRKGAKETERSDDLQFYPTAKVLANAALNTHQPITIGVYGNWGSGKTSLMRLMMEEVNKKVKGRKPAVAVWFNAWQYEHEEHLIIPLIATIAREIKNTETSKKFTRKAKESSKKVHDALRSVLYGISMKGKLGVPGMGEMEISASMQEMIERYEALTQDTLMARSLYFDAFDNLREISREEDPDRPQIVVFIDDLDRCFPERAVHLLESIKLILHQPGFAFVLGIYPQIIEEFIRNKYAGEYHLPVSETDSELHKGICKYLDYFKDYLDKIVQVRHYVPEREADDMKSYIENLLIEADVKDEFLKGGINKDMLFELIAETGEHNPRKVVRKLNGLIVKWLINEEETEKEEDRYDLLAMLINEVGGEPKYDDFRTDLDYEPKKDDDTTIGKYLADALEKITADNLDKRIEELRAKTASLESPTMERVVKVLEQEKYFCNVLKSEPGLKWLGDNEYRANLREKLKEDEELRDNLHEKLKKMAVALEEKAEDGTKRAMEPGDISKQKATIISRLLESMKVIPAGSFMMGAENGGPNEQPVHKVELSGFKMSETPVTQAQYEAVMGKNPSHFKGPDRPVERISWDDAKVFCERLSKETGKKFTLPTEAEWEYACRAGTETNYYTGDEEDDLDRAGWYGKNSEIQTHEVKGKAHNKYGLYDMHGNVWEWCQDWFAEDYYSNSPGKDPKGPDTGSYRVLRGGSWKNKSIHCRSFTRGIEQQGRHVKFLGFRVVCR
jgi:formylglycine-generating enzyme required for sulfatase activity